jgi:uncharacterized delta-60 repeat protein
LIRFRPDGTLDRTFGDEGIVVSFVGWSVRTLAIDGRGRIVVSGVPYKEGGEGSLADLDDFIVARYTARGELDPTFGTVRSTMEAVEVMWALAVQPDGRIVVAGQSGRTFSEQTGFALARLR